MFSNAVADKQIFGDYLVGVNRQYQSDEYTYRLKIFEENRDFINKFNQQNDKLKLDLGVFADWTHLEFQQHHGFDNPQHLDWEFDHYTEQQNQMFEFNELLDRVDWRDQGIVSPVQNQGQCGSCWSWATAGSVESLNAIKTGTLTVLSKQQLVDCSSENSGCNGGRIDAALQYIADFGLESDQDYAYEAQDMSCKYDSRKSFATISGFRSIRPRSPDQLAQVLQQQPVPVTIDAGSRVFQFYKSGIIDSDNCGTDINHATLAIGYGEENGVQYWIVKNSWGQDWGEQGYFRIRRQYEHSEGTCGITKLRSFYPVDDSYLSNSKRHKFLSYLY